MAKHKEVEVRVPAKLGTQGPESGPTGETVVDVNAPAPAHPPFATDAKADKAHAKLQQAAENEKVAREVKVIATRRGYLGGRLQEEGTVFTLLLDKGDKLPSWVEAVPADTGSTPPTHSAEAQQEYVGKDGVGKKIDGNDVL